MTACLSLLLIFKTNAHDRVEGRKRKRKSTSVKRKKKGEEIKDID